VSATIETERLRIGELVMRSDPRHRDAHVRYWVVFVYAADDSVAVVPENRQGNRLIVPMGELRRVYQSPTRYP
jgi:hypothetical protein